mmetsp:Transcript_5172/g.7457  ORF Transcript_5172/g.7457 Transcript_5172/m.7457 type:complete len:205 (+) Transcript_5172:3-617(+)
MLWLGRNPVIGSKRKRPRLLLGGEEDAPQAPLENETAPDDLHADHAQLDLSERPPGLNGRPSSAPTLRCNVMELPQEWVVKNGSRRTATANGPAWRGLSAGGGRRLARPKSSPGFRSSIPSSPQRCVHTTTVGADLAGELATCGSPSPTAASGGAAPAPRSPQQAKADLWFNSPEVAHSRIRRPRSAMGPRTASYADHPASLRF